MFLMPIVITEILGGQGRVVFGADGFPAHVGDFGPLTTHVDLPGFVELHPVYADTLARVLSRSDPSVGLSQAFILGGAAQHLTDNWDALWTRSLIAGADSDGSGTWIETVWWDQEDENAVYGYGLGLLAPGQLP